MTVGFQRSVLIVDRSEESREVLQTALERRGWRILAASRARRGLELARRHQPDLIVLDLDVDESGPEALGASFSEDSEVGRIPIVMLGSLRRSPGRSPTGEFVAKPYQYGPLIRKIEELLDSTSRSHHSAVTVRDPRQRPGDAVRTD